MTGAHDLASAQLHPTAVGWQNSIRPVLKGFSRSRGSDAISGSRRSRTVRMGFCHPTGPKGVRPDPLCACSQIRSGEPRAPSTAEIGVVP